MIDLSSEQLSQTLPAFTEIMQQHDHIYVIVSPPRCSSTAFARVFWEQPSIRYYAHEPFETTYYLDQDLDDVAARLDDAIDLQSVKKNITDIQSNSLVIKEMPYQVGNNFLLLADMTSKPVIFLMRDPRLNIASRIEKKEEVGDSPYFPLIETGWELLAAQIELCEAEEIPYLIADAAEFRNHPVTTFSQIFAQLELPFSPETIGWQARQQLSLDNLEGQHSHLYDHVLQSMGMEPDNDPIPPVEWFSTQHGLQAHVVQCLQIYQTLRRSPARIRL